MNSNEPFTLSWEEMVDLYEDFSMIRPETDILYNLFERLQNALQPRNVVEG